MKRRFLFIAFAFIFFFISSCKKELGKYVYVDALNVLHIDNKCSKIMNVNGVAPIEMYPVKCIEYSVWNKICSNCINDDDYEKIQEEIRNNVKEKEFALELNKKIYDKLIECDEDRWYNFDTFNAEMQNRTNFNNLIKELKQKGYDVDNWLFGNEIDDIIDIDSVLKIKLY